jgi:hypothetical protein
MCDPDIEDWPDSFLGFEASVRDASEHRDVDLALGSVFEEL